MNRLLEEIMFVEVFILADGSFSGIVYGEMYVWQFFGDVARLSGASKVSIVVWSNIGLNSIGIILWVWVKIDLGVYMVIEKKKMKFAFI